MNYIWKYSSCNSRGDWSRKNGAADNSRLVMKWRNTLSQHKSAVHRSGEREKGKNIDSGFLRDRACCVSEWDVVRQCSIQFSRNRLLPVCVCIFEQDQYHWHIKNLAVFPDWRHFRFVFSLFSSPLHGLHLLNGCWTGEIEISLNKAHISILEQWFFCLLSSMKFSYGFLPLHSSERIAAATAFRLNFIYYSKASTTDSHTLSDSKVMLMFFFPFWRNSTHRNEWKQNWQSLDLVAVAARWKGSKRSGHETSREEWPNYAPMKRIPCFV